MYDVLTIFKELDSKTISRLEKAVAKSEYSQGKKLKIVTNVSLYPISGNTTSCLTLPG